MRRAERGYQRHVRFDERKHAALHKREPVQRCRVQPDRRLAGHVPAGGRGDERAQHAVMRHRDDRGFVRLDAGEPRDDTGDDVARAFAARWAEIEAACLVFDEGVAVARTQFVEARAFPRAPVHLDQRRLDAWRAAGEHARGRDGARQRARDPCRLVQVGGKPPAPRVGEPGRTQWNVAAALHPPLRVPFGARVADDGDQHGNAAAVERRRRPQASRTIASRRSAATGRSCCART